MLLIIFDILNTFDQILRNLLNPINQLPQSQIIIHIINRVPFNQFFIIQSLQQYLQTSSKMTILLFSDFELPLIKK